MNPTSADSNFEKFRRERRQRRAQFGGVPVSTPKAGSVSDVEAYEERQVQETRLTRDVHDFLAEATKHAATIVEKVTQIAEAEAAQRLAREMHEFLEETMRRAARFMHMVQGTPRASGVQDLEPHVSNLVGPPLDEFRHEGTASLTNKHIGQNPFDTEEDGGDDERDAMPPAEAAEPSVPEEPAPAPKAPPAPARSAPAKAGEPRAATPKAAASRTTDPRTTEVKAAEPDPAPVPAAAAAPAPQADALAAVQLPDGKDGCALFLERVGRDPATLKRALKALVQTRVLTPDEAREIYRDALQGSTS